MEDIKVNLENLSDDERENLLKLIKKANRPKPKRWKPNGSEIYYVVYANLGIGSYIWGGREFDNRVYNAHNCFQTREEAEFEVERRKVIAELENFAEENNDESIDWLNSKQIKWFIGCEVQSINYVPEIKPQWTMLCPQHGVIFTSRKICNKAIETIGKDRLLKYYFKVQ